MRTVTRNTCRNVGGENIEKNFSVYFFKNWSQRSDVLMHTDTPCMEFISINNNNNNNRLIET